MRGCWTPAAHSPHTHLRRWHHAADARHKHRYASVVAAAPAPLVGPRAAHGRYPTISLTRRSLAGAEAAPLLPLGPAKRVAHASAT